VNTTTKTEYLESDNQTNWKISIGDTTWRRRYLGSTISCDCDVTPAVRVRIKLLVSSMTAVARRLKGQIYKTVVRPGALYCADCCLAAASHERALFWGCNGPKSNLFRVWKTLFMANSSEIAKISKKPTLHGKFWKIRFSWCKAPCLCTDLSRPWNLRLREEHAEDCADAWSAPEVVRGHVMWRENSVTQTTLRLNSAGQKPRGRPKRWLDRLNEDMRPVNAPHPKKPQIVRWNNIPCTIAGILQLASTKKISGSIVYVCL